MIKTEQLISILWILTWSKQDNTKAYLCQIYLSVKKLQLLAPNDIRLRPYFLNMAFL